MCFGEIVLLNICILKTNHTKKNGRKKLYIHFGNLAMISQSFNSQQSNDHIQIKFARIHEQLSNKSLQSIKMFLMCKLADFNYQNWTMKLAKEHEK